MPINKVVYGDTTVIDLTDSTLSDASQLLSGVTAYDRSGAKITGTNDYTEWTSGIYLDDDGYIRVSPLLGAGGVYYENGFLYFGSEQAFSIPDGDNIGFGYDEYANPPLLTFNGHWEYDHDDTVDVTEGNHFVAVTHQGWGVGGLRTITRSDGKPWFGFNPGFVQVVFRGDTTPGGNDRVGFMNQDGTSFWEFNNGYALTRTITAPTPVYGIGVKNYWDGTRDFYLEVYCDGMRII